MKLIKRMPLWGKKVMSLILILLLIGAVIGIVSNKKDKEVDLQTVEQPTVNVESDETVDEVVKEEDNTIEKTESKTPDTQLEEKPEPKEQEQENNAPQETTTNNGTSLGQFKITAYCNCSKCCGKWAGGPTASGVMPAAGRTIAVDPKVIPLGTKVIIDGHTYVAEDTGGAIKGNKIDMYFNSHSEALAWGVKYKEVSLG